jgi:hypothetical protein
VSCCCEKLVAEDGDISERGKSAVERSYRTADNEDVTLGTSVCVFVCVVVNCKV